MGNAFHLQVSSLDGLKYDGMVKSVSLRCSDGDRAILAGHTNLCTAVGMGRAKVILEDDTEKYAACIGGLLSVMNGECRLIVTTWEWEEDIDADRAESALKRAEEKLSESNLSEKEYRIAKAKVNRALVRLETYKLGAVRH